MWRISFAAVPLALVVAGCSSAAKPEASATPAGGDAGIVSGGSVSGQCVELYSIENLRKRRFAFDGVVKSVAPAGEEPGSQDRATFTVNEWFKGGSEPEVTLTADGLLAITPDSDVAAVPGARLLVSGDDGNAFICGFTQPYSASLATEWRAALA